jgi:lipopolysaccharide transport system permease protein
VNDPIPSPLVLEAGSTDRQYWWEVYRYRELLFILAWRDVSVRYKQTIIGVAWAVLRPFLTMIVFTLVFGRLAKLPSDGDVPYALMVFAAILPWQLFSSILSDASGSIVGNASLISKVYFPRIIVPLASVAVGIVDFVISLAILVLLMFWYGFLPGWQALLLPFFVALGLVASIGPSLWVAALNVKYRDFRYAIPFLLQAGLYISPIGFSSSVVPEEWRLLYSLNPMVGVIDGFRWGLLGGDSPLYLPGFTMSITIALLSLWYGTRQFRRTERAFADLM